MQYSNLKVYAQRAQYVSFVTLVDWVTACCLLQPHIDSSLSGVVKVLEKKQEDEENLIEKEEEMVKEEKEKETMKEALSSPVVDVATDIKVIKYLSLQC